MTLRIRVSTFLALLAVPAFAQQPAAAPPPGTPLPVDAKVKIGTLPNGLRYYIRQNPKPEKRAELRLVVNAGAILEDETQLGGAHFLEHTAFNGTKHFAKNDLVKYLESIGVRFGADLNARTGFDETIYILPVPTDTARIVEQAFTILEDWAHGQVFDSAEVVNERGVVREEWRGSQGAGERMFKQWLPIAFRGSRYATRLPIGTEESIMRQTPTTLRNYYTKWYRPDLMAVIAVGDFDPAAIEAQIKRHFGSIPKPRKPTPRPSYGVPGNRDPLVAISSDREATNTIVQLSYKLPVTVMKTVGDYRRTLTEQLYLRMLNDRFEEISQKADAPFLGASASKGGFFARTIEAFTLGAAVKDGGIERGLEALLTEARRVDQFGFLQSELDRTRADFLRGYERAYAEREKTLSSSYVNEYIGNFLEQEAIPGIEYEYRLTQSLMPTITLDEVNHLASSWIADSNRVIIVQTPEKPGVAIPTERDLLAVFSRVANTPVTAYAENLSGDALVDSPPTPGRVVASKPIASIGATEWSLSNGARVIIKPTDFKADQVLFAAYSPGGTAMTPDSMFVSAVLASQVAQIGGIGKFNRTDLGKKLAGKAVRLSPTIGETTEGLTGSASPKDIETLFQLAWLTFTSPRSDSAAFLAFLSQAGTFVANRGASPEQVYSDTVQVTMSQHDFRARPLTPAVLAELKAEKSMAFYRDRFADASDFTFVFVGNVDTIALKPLVERYLASLPSLGRKETPKVTGGAPPKGVVQKIVRKGTEPKASTLILFTGPCTFTPENRFKLRALTTLAQSRLIETLREKLGGTYSPTVGGGCSREPRQEYSIAIRFGSSPENVEALSAAAFSLIDSLQTTLPSQADVDKVKEQILRTREVDLKENGYWLSNIIAKDQAHEDFAGILAPYDEMVKKLTAADLRDAARLYFNTKNYARFVLLPEAAKPTP